MLLVGGTVVGACSTSSTSPSVGTSASPVATNAPSAGSSAPASAEATPGASAPPASSPSPLPIEAMTGTDGRFTILLLGSDYRPAKPGNRTDTIMIVSVVPETGETEVASIPRDNAGIPLPDGTTHREKINTLYETYRAAGGDAAAGENIKEAIGYLTGVEIDYYALVGFGGIRDLVNAIGGVDVTVAKTIHDPIYHTAPGEQGITFPRGVNHLDGPTALIFARTRKGDNDFERIRRQQQLVAETTRKVLDMGLAALPPLVELSRNYIKTDLPLEHLPTVYDMVSRADLDTDARHVLGPTRFSEKTTHGTDYRLKVAAVREFMADLMPPVD